MPIVRIDCSAITDRDEFHRVFALALGFPPFYGRNMDAWIDCMESLDSPGDGMTNVHCEPPDVVALVLVGAGSMPAELHAAVLECAAFVNASRIEAGKPPVLAIASLR
jgi:hypothetical protein